MKGVAADGVVAIAFVESVVVDYNVVDVAIAYIHTVVIVVVATCALIYIWLMSSTA